MRATTLCFLACAASSTFASESLAADFTLNIPVRLENIQGAQFAKAACDVKTADGRIVASGFYPNPPAAVTGDPFTTTIVAEMNATSTSSAASATQYSCQLQVQLRTPHGTIVWTTFGDIRGALPSVPGSGQTLISAVPTVAGPLH